METTQGSNGRSAAAPGSSEGSFQLRVERSLKRIEDSLGKVEERMLSSGQLHETTMTTLKAWAESHPKSRAEEVTRLNTLVEGHQRVVAKLQQEANVLLQSVEELKRVQTDLKHEEVAWRRDFAVEYAAYSDANLMHMFNTYNGNPPPVGSDQQRVEKLFIIPKVNSETGEEITKKKKKTAAATHVSKK